MLKKMQVLFVFMLILGIALPVNAAPLAADDGFVNFTILHTNDFHGNLEPAGSNPGAARVATKVKEIRAAKAALNQDTLLFDAGEAGPEAPRGPQFMSPEWRELYKHAVREADRLGIVLGVNLCSGWNAGGAWVTAEHAAKKIVGAPATVKGPGRVTVSLRRSIVFDIHPLPG